MRKKDDEKERGKKERGEVISLPRWPVTPPEHLFSSSSLRFSFSLSFSLLHTFTSSSTPERITRAWRASANSLALIPWEAGGGGGGGGGAGRCGGGGGAAVAVFAFVPRFGPSCRGGGGETDFAGPSPSLLHLHP